MEPFYFQPKAFGYQPDNAYSLALASKLAYEANSERAEAQGRDWGFDRVFFFDERDTQAVLLADDEKIIVAFRGSEVILDDWITNSKIRQTAGPFGNVHRGFKAALNWVWLSIEETIEDIRAEKPPEKQQTLWLTGHSLGGALATMAAATCKFNETPIVVNGLYTFGQPRVGSEKFASNFNAAFRSQTFRFVNNNDVVTRVPPSICDYSHVGQLKYFDQKGMFNADADLSWWDQFWDRMGGHLDTVRDRHPDSIIDHSLDGRYLPFIKRHWETIQASKPKSTPSGR